MTIAEIERRLAAAQGRLERALRALAPEHRGGEWATYAYPSAEERDAEEVVIIRFRVVTGVVRDRWYDPSPQVSEPLEELA